MAAALSGDNSAKPQPQCWTPIYSLSTVTRSSNMWSKVENFFPLSLHSYQIVFKIRKYVLNIKL